MLLAEDKREVRVCSRYFSSVLVLFLLSYIFLSSAKWTNNIFYVLFALPGLFFLLKERGAGLLGYPLAWAWSGFLLWFLVPAVIAGDPQFYKHILYVALFVFVVAGFADPVFLRSGSFARALFWVIALYIFASAVYSWITGIFIFGQRVGLLPGRMENVIYVSIWLFCALGLAMPIWGRERRWLEAIFAIVISLIAVAFVLQTRTALVGAAFLFGLWTLYGIYRFPRQGLVVMLAAVVLFGLTLWLVHDESWFQSLFARGDSYRIELFRIMTGEWGNCGWVLGCGVDFQTTQTLAGGIPIQHPHNIFVALGVYTGGISLILFMVVMAMTLWQAWRRRDPWGVYLACALVMLNLDGSKLIGNPDELWPLVLLPAALILGRAVRERNAFPV